MEIFNDETQSISPVTREELVNRINALNLSLAAFNEKVDLCAGTLSITGFIKDVSHHFVNGLSGFATGFMEFIKSPFASNNPLPQYKDFDKYKQKAISITNNHKIAEEFVSKYGSIDVPYIASCRVSLKAIVSDLRNVRDDSASVIIKGLKELDEYISNALTDTSFRTSTRPYKLGQGLGELEKFTTKIMDINKAVIDPTSLEDHRLLNFIIPNIQDYKDITNDLNMIKEYTDYKILVKVDDLVKSISAKAKALAEELNNKENAKDCNKQFIKDVKNVLEIGANGVTYLATYYYLIAQSVQSYKVSLDVIK